ncbi:MAG: phosphohistidine phosphatase SixA [Anaerolineae bacterium]|nr:phosphohistidine phosphatase SixA [Anaerolineae bacterium]
MKLYFVRHGKASQVAPSDAERPLTSGGVESVKHMAQVLHKAGCHPTKIYSSPRLRASQTAHLIADELGIDAEINAACNFSFNAAAALQLCSGFDDEAEIMFVGHNPSMSDVVESITGASVQLSTGQLFVSPIFTHL